MPFETVEEMCEKSPLQPDGSVFYPFTGERLIPQDYTITATSRVTHLWAYIVTLLIIALAIGSFFYRRKR